MPYLLRFAANLTLTNGASLILPGGADIVTAAGDVAVVVHDTASVWRVAFYSRAAMRPLIVGTAANNLVALDGAGKLPAVPGDQLTSLPPQPDLGVGQTWQNMLASREQNTVYQNTSGRPIMVHTVGSGSSALPQVSANNVTWFDVGIGAAGTFSGVGWVVVPNGHYYRINTAGTPTRWLELR